MGSIKGKLRNNTEQAILKGKRGTVLTSKDWLVNEWAVFKRKWGTILVGKDGLMKEWAVFKRNGGIILLGKGSVQLRETEE